jgi:hypothetical protein
VTNPYDATSYHSAHYGAAYPAYRPPTTVNYYGSSCGNCGGWSTAGAAAAGPRSVWSPAQQRPRWTRRSSLEADPRQRRGDCEESRRFGHESARAPRRQSRESAHRSGVREWPSREASSSRSSGSRERFASPMTVRHSPEEGAAARFRGRTCRSRPSCGPAGRLCGADLLGASIARSAAARKNSCIGGAPGCRYCPVFGSGK